MQVIRHLISTLLGVALAMSAMGAAPPPSDPPSASHLPSSAAIAARYVVLAERGGQTVGYARAVVSPGQPCPALVAKDGQRIPMVTRSNRHGFAVLVCEAELPAAGAALLLADGTLSLPSIPEDPRKVLVLGDTGCKAPHGDHPGCVPGAPAEPLAAMATAAAGQPWDLIVHLGDSNYRGTAGGKRLFTVAGDDGTRRQVAHWTYDAGDETTAAEQCEQGAGAGFWSQNAPNANDPDRWETWRDDVFAPLGDLLSAAPWVFVRGNHELCSRAGPGWFYFLDPSSALGGGEQLDCPPPTPSLDPLDHVRLTEPYEIRVGGLSLVVLDTANACDFFSEPRFAERYGDQLRRLGQLAPPPAARWILTHRPIWALTRFDERETSRCAPGSDLACPGVMLREALQAAAGQGPVLGDANLVLAGHLHQFQALAGDRAGRPPSVIVGTGGVSLADVAPRGTVTSTVGGVEVEVLSLGTDVLVDGRQRSAHGFLEIDLDRDGQWTAVLRDRSRGIDLVSCSAPNDPSDLPCRLAGGVALPPEARRE